MYKISVPVLINNGKFEEYFDNTVSELKRAEIDRIFLCPSRCIVSKNMKSQELDLLKEYIPILIDMGFEVGLWLSSLGHGGELSHEFGTKKEYKYRKMVGLNGKTFDDSFCPLDKNFESDFCDWIADLASTGASMIMLDDDYRLSFRGGDVFCCCDEHVEIFNARIGENLKREDLYDLIFSGGQNKYRDTWLNLQRDTLINYAKSLRRSVDKVNRDVRLGHCAVLSTWDLDGADSIELAYAFAGDTKPFLRLIGASYWAAAGNFNNISMGSVIAYERLQQYWCQKCDIELFSECDSYPRPRYTVPAAYVEGLDTAMRASGGMAGSLKYMIDYISSPLYEKGYIERHINNKELYQEIEKRFNNRRTEGIKVFEPMKTLQSSSDCGDLYDRCIPASLRYASDLSLPITFDETEMPTIIFGDGATYIDDEILKNGAILDIKAAKICMSRGIDIGISGIDKKINVIYENYKNERVLINGGEFFEIIPNEKAEIISNLTADKIYCGVIKYENQKGQKFLVYPFDAQKSYMANGVFRSYSRQEQLINEINWLCDGEIIAISKNNPDLSMIVKSSENSLSVGLWNFFEDSILKPKIYLNNKYSRIEAFNCSASINDNCVTLSEIMPFSIVLFEVFE